MGELPWELVEDDIDRKWGQARVLNAANELVCATQPVLAGLIVAAVNACIECPRCEGQEYDRGSCSLCRNVGWLGRNGEALVRQQEA